MPPRDFTTLMGSREVSIFSAPDSRNNRVQLFESGIDATEGVGVLLEARDRTRPKRKRPGR